MFNSNAINVCYLMASEVKRDAGKLILKIFLKILWSKTRKEKIEASIELPIGE